MSNNNFTGKFISETFQRILQFNKPDTNGGNIYGNLTDFNNGKYSVLDGNGNNVPILTINNDGTDGKFIGGNKNNFLGGATLALRNKNIGELRDIFLITNGSFGNLGRGLVFWRPFGSDLGTASSEGETGIKMLLRNDGSLILSSDPNFTTNFGGSGVSGIGKAISPVWRTTGPDADTMDVSPTQGGEAWRASSGGANVKLAVDGGVGARYFVIGSDKRLKENIQDIKSPLERLLGLKPKFYTLKTTPGLWHGGFIAQDVEEYIPESLRIGPKTDDPETTELKHLHMDTILSVAVGAIKELNEKVKSLEEEIKNIKNN